MTNLLKETKENKIFQDDTFISSLPDEWNFDDDLTREEALKSINPIVQAMVKLVPEGPIDYSNIPQEQFLMEALSDARRVVGRKMAEAKMLSEFLDKIGLLDFYLQSSIVFDETQSEDMQYKIGLLKDRISAHLARQEKANKRPTCLF